MLRSGTRCFLLCIFLLDIGLVFWPITCQQQSNNILVLEQPLELLGTQRSFGSNNGSVRVVCPPGKPALVVRAGPATITNAEFAGCEDTKAVIDIQCNGCEVLLDHVRFTENRAQYIITSRSAPLIPAILNQSVAPIVVAAPLQVMDVTGGQLTRLVMTQVDISGNVLSGGALQLNGTALRISNSHITSNNATRPPLQGSRGSESGIRQALIDGQFSSLNMTAVDVSSNEGWRYLMYLDRPLGVSKIASSRVTHNTGSTLIQLIARRIYTNETRYRELYDWLTQSGTPSEAVKQNGTLAREFIANLSNSKESLDMYFWSAPLHLVRSNIESNIVDQALVKITGALDHGGFFVLENSSVTRNVVGYGEKGDNEKVVDGQYPPALLCVPFTELRVLQDSLFAHNLVNGHLVSGTDTKVVLRDSQFVANKVTGLQDANDGSGELVHKGLLMNLESFTLNIRHCQFSNNSVGFGLLGVHKGNFSLDSSILRGNRINSTWHRSLVYFNDVRPGMVLNCTFIHNSVPRGALVDANYVTMAYINNNTFKDNEGSPLQMVEPFPLFEEENIEVNASIFENNRLSRVQRGKAREVTAAALSLFVKQKYTVLLQDLWFINNTLAPVTSSLPPDFQLQGGAMKVAYGDQGAESFEPKGVLINRVMFADNEIPGSGGGLWTGRPANISNCSFLGNMAGLQGGAIYAEGAFINIAHSIFINNTAESGGAVVANPQAHPCPDKNLPVCVGGSVEVSDSRFVGNIARMRRVVRPGKALWDTQVMTCTPGGGGALCMHPSNAVNITTVVMENNIAKWGGAVFLVDSCPNSTTGAKFDERQPVQKCPDKQKHVYNFTLTNTTINHNTAVNGTGGAIFFTSRGRLRLCCGPTCAPEDVTGALDPCPHWQGNIGGDFVRAADEPHGLKSLVEKERNETCGGTCGAMGGMPVSAKVTTPPSAYPRGSSLPDNITLSYSVTLYDEYEHILQTTPSTLNIQLTVRSTKAAQEMRGKSSEGHQVDTRKQVVDYVERPYTTSNLSLAIKVMLGTQEEVPIDLAIQGFDQDLLTMRPLDIEGADISQPLRVRPCVIGEGREGEGCLVCPRGLFSGHPFFRCEPCPSNGNCSTSGILVPQDNFWHSSPYSPNLLECPLTGACRGDIGEPACGNRTCALTQYIQNNSNVLMLLGKTNLSDHDRHVLGSVLQGYGSAQCSKGYQGYRCSGCAEGYGRRGYRCRLCPTVMRNAIIFMLIFVFLCGQTVLVVVNHIKSVNQMVFCPRVGEQVPPVKETLEPTDQDVPSYLYASQKSSGEPPKAPGYGEPSHLGAQATRTPLSPKTPAQTAEESTCAHMCSYGPSASRIQSCPTPLGGPAASLNPNGATQDGGIAQGPSLACLGPSPRVRGKSLDSPAGTSAGPHDGGGPPSYLMGGLAEDQILVITGLNDADPLADEQVVEERCNVSNPKKDPYKRLLPPPSILPPPKPVGPAFMLSAILKIMLTFVQMLSVAPRLRVSWPINMREFLQGASFSSPLEWFSLQCFVKGSDAFQEMFRTLVVVALPLLMTGVAALMWTSIWHIQSLLRNTMRRSSAGGRRRAPLIPAGSYIWPRLIATVIQICFLVYPMVTGVVMEIFPCDEMDEVKDNLMRTYFDTVKSKQGTDGSTMIQAIWPGLSLRGDPMLYWTRNYNILCSPGSTQHRLKWAVGVPALVLFVVGFPLACTVVVYKSARTRSLQDPQVALKYGFLYEAYQEKYSYWENLILLRKGMLLAASIFLAPYGPSVQLPTCILLLLISALGQEVFQPFRVPLLNRLERDSIFVILFNFIVVSYLTSDEMSRAMVFALFSVVLMGTLALLGELLYFMGKYSWNWMVQHYDLDDGQSVGLVEKLSRVVRVTRSQWQVEG